MTKLLAAVVLATVIASLAFAQLYDPSRDSGNLNSAPDQNDQPPQSSTPHVGFELTHEVDKR
jgi:hypothetical protein